MKVRYLLIAAAMMSAPFAASADRWDDDRRGHRYDREYKQEYWEGNCKVKREYKKGKYKEKRECREPRRAHRHDHRYRGDVYYSSEPRIIIDPGIRIGR